jgi:hypothetical protein
LLRMMLYVCTGRARHSVAGTGTPVFNQHLHGDVLQEHQVRSKMVAVLQERFRDFGLRFVIGGQISIDIFPDSWDKTYCLRHLDTDSFDAIHFFGDRTLPVCCCFGRHDPTPPSANMAVLMCGQHHITSAGRE